MAYINVDEIFILDNTGLQVDQTTDLPFKDAGLTESQQAQARKNIAAGGTNPNLLDNPFFQVNQRSITSDSNPSATAVYTRDRWKIARCSAYTFNDDGTVTTKWDGTGSGCYLIQYAFPDTAAMLRGKTVTLSVYVGGTLYTKTLTLPNQTNNSFVIGDGLSVNIVDVIASGRGYECQFYHSVSAGKTIGPFKLELGSVSTLANDTPPNYAEELLKCQRYFYRIEGSASAKPIGWTFYNSANQIWICIPLPVTMRTTPSVTLTGTARVLSTGGSWGALTSISLNTIAGTVLTLNGNASGTFSNTGQYRVYLDGTGSYLDISADL